MFFQFDSTTAKLSDITVATVSMLNSMCKCDVTPNHVSQNEFTCFYNEAQEVIYRAKLQGVEANDCSNLTSHIREWMEASSSILIQGNRLSLNPTCDLEIETLDIQPACVIGETPPSPTTSSPNDSLLIEVIIGGAVAGGIIIVLLLALVVAVCCICCRRREKPDRYVLHTAALYHWLSNMNQPQLLSTTNVYLTSPEPLKNCHSPIIYPMQTPLKSVQFYPGCLYIALNVKPHQ